jgi:hypothetical protein
MQDEDFVKLLVAACLAAGMTPKAAIACALDTVQLMYAENDDE